MVFGNDSRNAIILLIYMNNIVSNTKYNTIQIMRERSGNGNARVHRAATAEHTKRPVLDTHSAAIPTIYRSL